MDIFLGIYTDIKNGRWSAPFFLELLSIDVQILWPSSCRDDSWSARGGAQRSWCPVEPYWCGTRACHMRTSPTTVKTGAWLLFFNTWWVGGWKGFCKDSVWLGTRNSTTKCGGFLIVVYKSVPLVCQLFLHLNENLLYMQYMCVCKPMLSYHVAMQYHNISIEDQRF